MAKTFWGGTFKYVSLATLSVLAVPAAVINGVVKGAIGEEFGKGFAAGFNELGDGYVKVCENIGDFGDKHNNTLTRSTIGAIAFAVVGDAVDVGIDHLPPDLHA